MTITWENHELKVWASHGNSEYSLSTDHAGMPQSDVVSHHCEMHDDRSLLSGVSPNFAQSKVHWIGVTVGWIRREMSTSGDTCLGWLWWFQLEHVSLWETLFFQTLYSQICPKTNKVNASPILVNPIDLLVIWACYKRSNSFWHHITENEKKLICKSNNWLASAIQTNRSSSASFKCL